MQSPMRDAGALQRRVILAADAVRGERCIATRAREHERVALDHRQAAQQVQSRWRQWQHEIAPVLAGADDGGRPLVVNVRPREAHELVCSAAGQEQ
jgi:hypothetical protein